MALEYDVHTIPKSVIIDSAKKVQKKQGYFTTYDIFYEIFPITRRTITKAHDRSASRYLTWIVLEAGAVSLGCRSSRRQVMYVFREKSNV